MTELLLKLFVKDYENSDNPQVRTACGKLAGRVGIVCNVFLCAAKLIAGLVSGSVSIMADAVNNLSDASSSLISLFGFKLAGKPADAEHPYGHARYEYLSGLVVSILICVIGIELLRSCVEKIITPEKVIFGAVSVIILAASILLKLWMMIFVGKIGKKIKSKTLMATSADSRNDVISTSAVLLGVTISHFTGINFDGYIGFLVALFILYSGFGLVRDTLDPILGKAPDPEFVNHIQDKILSYPGVLGTHDLLVHDYGPGRMFASVHVEMAAEEDVIVSHDVLDNIERDFYENENLHMVVHYDPIVTKDDSVKDTRRWLAETVKSIHPALSIHDLRIVPGTTHTNLIFDCVVPHEIGMSNKEVKEKIEAKVKAKEPTYFCVITIDSSYVSISD